MKDECDGDKDEYDNLKDDMIKTMMMARIITWAVREVMRELGKEGKTNIKIEYKNYNDER